MIASHPSPATPPPFSVPQLAARWGCSAGLVDNLCARPRLEGRISSPPHPFEIREYEPV
jgi:hypothetical protein